MFRELTLDKYEEFAHRKKSGRISFLVLPYKEQIYYVPRAIEHIDFASNLLSLNPSFGDISFLIPTHIDTKMELKEDRWGMAIYILKLISGVSGMETGYGVRHKKEDIIEAHKMIVRLIDGANPPFYRDDSFSEDIVMRYTKISH